MTTPRVTVPRDLVERLVAMYEDYQKSDLNHACAHSAFVGWQEKHDDWKALSSSLSAAPAPEGVASLLDAADKAHRACMSAWSCGEPYHRVKTMMDAVERLGAVVAQCKDAALATREEVPAEEGEDAEAIVRRWANWIIDESSDMDHDDHDAGKRKIRAERDFILRSLRAQPPAREDAQPVAWLYETAGGFHTASVEALTRIDGHKVFGRPLYTHPAPDALRLAVEALEKIKAVRVCRDSANIWTGADACRKIATEALAALQAEQGAK